MSDKEVMSTPAKLLGKTVLTDEEIIALNKATDREISQFSQGKEGNFKTEEIDDICMEGERIKLRTQAIHTRAEIAKVLKEITDADDNSDYGKVVYVKRLIAELEDR